MSDMSRIGRGAVLKAIAARQLEAIVSEEAMPGMPRGAEG